MRLPMLLTVSLLTTCVAVQSVAAGDLRVMTTTTDLAALTAAVGGNLVKVDAIARGSQDPHYVDARPSYMRRLHGADLLVFNGLELEIGWLPLLVEGSRNPRLAAGADGILDASTGLPILEIPTMELDRSRGDIHPGGNPHYTLSPLNGRRISGTILSRLQELRPDQASYFEERREHFTFELDTHLAAWKERTRSWRGTKIIAHHKQWEYLAAWLGLEIVAYIEEKPGIPPTPRHVSELVTLIEREQIRVILRSTFAEERPSDRLAQRTSARVVELPAAVGAVAEANNYISLIDVILDRLETSMSEEPVPGEGS
ncbi:MAG: zinc ABC transporter substrate-binding protein [Gemmatimonadetes bacterium]|jgi:zinc/manganese transport system substrate-binding protein|nr:zinc ABC transporter substrate-binding protein [Gemmatimonadota bacterium]MBT6146908.1 zinc ABC transporter substrate-binding protein [Gemmatimonadota bacterium]MBT7862570.1 zinc ABC transporter substrate-binding protein [Gemmatimonadota bacterium]